MRDSTNSRLGIKTTTPQTALDVNGGAYFGLDGNNFTLEALQSNTNAFKYDNLNSTISLFEDNDGKVGIGTGSPAYKLDVNGTGRIQNALYFGSIEETQNNYFMPQIYHEYERFYLK